MPTEREDLPRTLRRSPAKVRRTYRKALDAAHEEYGSEQRAHRTAWAAVKHIAEKRGDRWELKDRRGPSDGQAAQGGRQARTRPKRTAGGVDVLGRTRDELRLRQAPQVGRGVDLRQQRVGFVGRHRAQFTAVRQRAPG